MARRQQPRQTPEEAWREIIEEWRQSRLTPKVFCERERYSLGAFQQFAEKLFGSTYLKDAERGVADAAHTAEISSASVPKPNPFVPIRLLSDGQSQSSYDKYAPLNQVEIMVPGGAVIRVTENCSLDFVAKLFSSLKA